MSWRSQRIRTALQAHGEPMVWLTGGALGISLAMIVGLLALVVMEGTATFWPRPVLEIKTIDGEVYLGELSKRETFHDEPVNSNARASATEDSDETPVQERLLLRTGNFDLTGNHYRWIEQRRIKSESMPEWAIVMERTSWGRFYGFPKTFLVEGKPVANVPAEVWSEFRKHWNEVTEREARILELRRDAIGTINRSLEAARLDLRRAERRWGKDSPDFVAANSRHAKIEESSAGEFREVRAEMERLEKENARFEMVMLTADGTEKPIPLATIVRAFPANQLTTWDKWSVYFDRWTEFLTGEPREANSEGGVFPAIWGTVAMTMIMTFLVVPFGVLAALYLREYAKAGWLVSLVRIAVNNLAGVPSIVFGVFGLGFFCYIMGGNIDQLFFSDNLPNPTFGKGGLLWSSLTLALLTLPVVIVATEEALAAVPGSMREGSYACGASKWQTIRRIVLPRAMPGILTGMMLAVARGAGEVAPLMLVGAVKLAPDLPFDNIFPFVHPQRSFMHLGFHIYDLGFQSQNSEAAKPMVFTTTMLLVVIVATLGLLGVWVRRRVQQRFRSAQF
ncbi:MAG: phosphate ABC transporter permease PstA [Planctomycetota bacterium]